MANTGYDTDYSSIEKPTTEADKDTSAYEDLDLFGDFDYNLASKIKIDDIDVNADPSIIKNKIQLERALVKGIAFTLELEEISECILIHLSVNEFRLLCDALKKTTKLKVLNLGGQPYLGSSIKLLEDAIKVNTSLHELILGGNIVNVEVCKSICEILKANKTLRIINIEWARDMEPDCYKYIAEGLLVNNTLVEMRMGENHLNDEGLKYLKAAVEVNKTVRWLNIDDSDVTNSEWQYVVGKTNENWENQKKFTQDTMVIIHNLIRDGSVLEKLPVEIWCHVFSFVTRLGVFIDFGQRFKTVLDKYNTKNK